MTLKQVGRALPWRPSLPLRQPADPGLVALRRGARAALVIPLALLFGRFVVGDPQNLIFIVFGCFALLVMADFSGPLPTRSLAYLGTTFVGAVLVALGTLASPTAVAPLRVRFAGEGSLSPGWELLSDFDGSCPLNDFL